MWTSNVTRELLLQKLSLLAMLGSVRDGPKEHVLVSRPDRVSSMTIDQEREVASNLAFLSSRSKNSKRVIAVGIEEDRDGQGMVIRMAVNGGDKDVPHLKEGLKRISTILEQVSRREQSEIGDVGTLLRQVVRGDFSRMSTRLQLGRNHRIEASQVMLLYQTLHDRSITGIESSELEALRDEATTLLDLFRRLKKSPLAQDNPRAYDIMEAIVRLAHNLNQSTEFAAAVNTASRLSFEERVSLQNTLLKLGHYYKASYELVLAARRRKYRIFRKIRVESFQISVPDDVTSASPSISAIPLIKDLVKSLDTSKLLSRFHGSESAANAALLRRLNSSRSGIKIHAEVKLLFYYEVHPENVRPRVLCANKSACYLCDLFIRVHGEFQTPRTFGNFNERWILPDWLDSIPPGRTQALGNIVEQFSAILDSEIGLALKNTKRRFNPLESAVGLSAQWSSFTTANSPSSCIPGGDAVVPVSLTPGLNPSPSEHPANLQLIEKPTASSSSSCSILVLAPSVPPTPVSSEFPDFETLRPGKHIWGRLAKEGQSFTVTFHDLFAVVSFDVGTVVSNMQCAALWVRIGLLEAIEQQMLSGGGRNVVPLQDIPAGAQVEVERNGIQTIVYVHWKQLVISIQYR